MSTLFPIYFYYSDTFPHFSHGKNFRLFLKKIGDRNFLIFWRIIYFRKEQNLRNLWNITVTKNNPLKVRHQKLQKLNKGLFLVDICVSTIKINLYMCCERINSFNFSTFPNIPIIRTHLQIANPILGSGAQLGH